MAVEASQPYKPKVVHAVLIANQQQGQHGSSCQVMVLASIAGGLCCQAVITCAGTSPSLVGPAISKASAVWPGTRDVLVALLLEHDKHCSFWTVQDQKSCRKGSEMPGLSMYTSANSHMRAPRARIANVRLRSSSCCPSCFCTCSCSCSCSCSHYDRFPLAKAIDRY